MSEADAEELVGSSTVGRWRVGEAIDSDALKSDGPGRIYTSEPIVSQ